MSEPKIFRFICREDISEKLKKIEGPFGTVLIDAFTIREQTFGNFLYETTFHSIGVADYKLKLEELLRSHNIHIKMMPVRESDNLKLFSNVIWNPEIKIEQKEKK